MLRERSPLWWLDSPLNRNGAFRVEDLASLHRVEHRQRTCVYDDVANPSALSRPRAHKRTTNPALVSNSLDVRKEDVDKWHRQKKLQQA